MSVKIVVLFQSQIQVDRYTEFIWNQIKNFEMKNNPALVNVDWKMKILCMCDIVQYVSQTDPCVSS